MSVVSEIMEEKGDEEEVMQVDEDGEDTNESDGVNKPKRRSTSGSRRSHAYDYFTLNEKSKKWKCKHCK